MDEGGLTRRIGIVACGRAASTFSIFAVNAILARTWPESEFGIFTAVWVLGNTLVPIFLIGLPTGLLYFFPHCGTQERKRLVVQAAVCLSLSGAALVVLLALAGPALASLLNIETRETESVDLVSYLWPFLPYVFSLVAGGHVESTLVAAGRARRQAALALAAATGLTAIAAAGAIMALSVQQVLWSLSVMGTVRFAVASVMAAAAIGVPLSLRTGWTANSLRLLLGYSLPIGLNDAVGSLSRNVDRFVILFFFTAETFAVYHVGAIEVPVSLLLAGVVTVLVPEVSRLYGADQKDDIGRLWRQAVSRLSLVVVPLFFFLFTFAGAIISIYLPATYQDSEMVFRIFLFALPLRSAIYNPLLVGMGKARWALWGGIGDLITNLSLSVFLVLFMRSAVPDAAFLGPAVATVVSTYLQVSVLVLLIARHLGWGLRQLMPWGRLLRISAASAVSAAVAALVSTPVSQALPQLILGGVAFAATMAIALWIRADDREEIVQIFKSIR